MPSSAAVSPSPELWLPAPPPGKFLGRLPRFIRSGEYLKNAVEPRGFRGLRHAPTLTSPAAVPPPAEADVAGVAAEGGSGPPPTPNAEAILLETGCGGGWKSSPSPPDLEHLSFPSTAVLLTSVLSRVRAGVKT